MKKLKWLLAAVVISFGPRIIAATISWTNSGTGDWITPANWSSGALPVSPDDARITNGGIAVIESPQEISTGSVTAGDILGTTGTLRVLGGKLSTLNTDIRIGGNNVAPTGGTGTFDQQGGIVAMSFANFNLGFGIGSHGTYNLSGGAFYLNTAGATVVIAVGNRGFGTVNQSGGEIFIKAGNGFTQLGRNIAAGTGFGTYNMSGGSLATGRLIFGDAVGTAGISTNVFNLSGAGVVRAGTIYVKNTSASNYFNFTGGTLLTTNVGFPLRNSGGILNPTFFDFGNAAVTNTETMVSNSIATLTISSNATTSYIQDPGGTLAIDIAGPGNNDMLNLGAGPVVGDVTLGGRIVVNLLNNYDPGEGTTFDIVIADNITNNAAIVGRTPSGRSFAPLLEFLGDDRAVLRLYVVQTPAP
ncbi:MAG TPA: hypothetical protein VGF13_21800, partial [Verrucomicrobiae bacterium]